MYSHRPKALWQSHGGMASTCCPEYAYLRAASRPVSAPFSPFPDLFMAREDGLCRLHVMCKSQKRWKTKRLKNRAGWSRHNQEVGMLPEIMKAQGRDSSGLSQTPPCGTPAFLRSRGIESPILTCGEHVVIRLC